MTLLDPAVLLAIAIIAIYMIWRFWSRYGSRRALHDVYYVMGFLVLLVSDVLLMVRGRSVLASPYVLTVSSLIPLGISMGIAEQYFPSWKRPYKWFALVGFLAIAITSIGQMTVLKKIAVPVFHGGAGLVIILGPFLSRKAPVGFRWVGIGGLFIGIAGLSLAVLSTGSQLMFFTTAFVMQILPGLLLLMTLAFTWGFMKELRS
jgi:hypothetical protein